MAERRRLAISAAFGAVVGLVALPFLAWELAALLAWDATSLTLIAWIWSVVGPMDSVRTQNFSTRADPSRTSTRALLLIASSTSLIGVLFALFRASQNSGGTRLVFTLTGIITVVASWGLVHTLYALRYAHLYYSDHPGGIDFAGDDQAPSYTDFAYLAFTVGMTFQVSDTNIGSPTIRGAVLRHALLSFLFGTVIVATSINVIASLLR